MIFKVGHIFIFCFLIMIPGLFAQQSRFDEANEYLDEGRYGDAISIYQSIAGDDYHSGALWLNMGIAYSHLDSLGVAKFYLLKAEKYTETRRLARQNLDYINERFSRRSAVLPPLPWDRFFQWLSEQYGLRLIVFSAIFTLYAGVAFVIGAWFRRELKKKLRYSAFTMLGLSAILFMFSVIIHYQQNRYGTGVMVNRQAAVFQQPDEQSSVVSTAFEGYTMRVDFKQSNDIAEWKYVRLENGMYGWIKNHHLMILSGL